MNELGYDLTTVGNHEWDDGPSTVARFWSNLKMPIVCANIDFSKEPELAKLVKPYHIFENLGVAIIGYITPVRGTHPPFMNSVFLPMQCKGGEKKLT